MRSNLQVCVSAALSYSDIFDYPLTQDQIHQFLVSKKASAKEVTDCLKELLVAKKIGQKGKFYFLPGREKIVRVRTERESKSKEKLKIARKTADILKFLPGVKFVGISGALACRNSKGQDDIDLFVITQAGQVWTTRFFSTLILDFLGKRRKPQDRQFKDKICLNLFLDEGDLALSPKDLFLAREIVQLEPLYDKDFCYSKFLSQNIWIKNFLPNWEPKSQPSIVRGRIENHKSKNFLDSGFWLLETALRKFQLFYMRKRITYEKLSKTRIFFHPTDVHYQVLDEYKKRLAQLPS